MSRSSRRPACSRCDGSAVASDIPLRLSNTSSGATSERNTPASRPGLKQGRYGRGQPLPALRERVAAGGDERAQRVAHAALGRHVVDEAVHPGAQGLVGRQVAQQVVDRVAQPGELVAVRRVDQRLAGGEVAVQRADADAGLLRDRFERDVRTVLGQHADGDLEQPFPVALRVGAQRRAVAITTSRERTGGSSG